MIHNFLQEFHGNMQKTTKFILTNPFYADEIRVYPLLFEGDRAFRMELYGCYLGEKVEFSLQIFLGYENKRWKISVIWNNLV